MRDSTDGSSAVGKRKKPSLAPELLPVNKHAPTALEKQRVQVAKLLQEPTQEIHLPKPPKEKSLRPPREMMKNVQGSSAGAGSGEFHVYKQSRRREYERLRLMDEHELKEKERIEFETKQAELRTQAESKTSKNRARRQKRKQHRVKKQEGTTTQAGAPVEGSNNDSDQESDDDSDTQQKRRKLGAAPIAEGITFKSQNMDEDDEESDGDKPARRRPSETKSAFLDVNASAPGLDAIPVIEPTGITIIEDEW